MQRRRGRKRAYSARPCKSFPAGRGSGFAEIPELEKSGKDLPVPGGFLQSGVMMRLLLICCLALCGAAPALRHIRKAARRVSQEIARDLQSAQGSTGQSQVPPQQ